MKYATYLVYNESAFEMSQESWRFSLLELKQMTSRMDDVLIMTDLIPEQNDIHNEYIRTRNYVNLRSSDNF